MADPAPNRRSFLERHFNHLLLSLALAILAMLLTPNFLDAQTRAKVSRTLTDMRSMSTAVEAYRFYENAYPAWAIGSRSDNAWRTQQHPVLMRLPAFHSPDLPQLTTLSTPISYTTCFPPDPFAPHHYAMWTYYAAQLDDGEGYLMTSAGPDRDYDIDPLRHFNPAAPQPSVELGLRSFDPTNGTLSDGDVWFLRYHQKRREAQKNVFLKKVNRKQNRHQSVRTQRAIGVIFRSHGRETVEGGLPTRPTSDEHCSSAKAQAWLAQSKAFGTRCGTFCRQMALTPSPPPCAAWAATSPRRRSAPQSSRDRAPGCGRPASRGPASRPRFC